jgi:hypothetical protein
MLRKMEKEVIACVGIYCNSFDELKEMNVMIPEVHEKMWDEEDRLNYVGISLLNY